MKSLKPHAWGAHSAPATGPVAPAYYYIPTVYLLCEGDRVTPLPVQQALVNRAQRLGATIETESIGSGHTPWLALPDQFIECIRKHAKKEA